MTVGVDSGPEGSPNLGPSGYRFTMAVSLDKPLGWSVGFFFGNVELSLELWTVIAGIPRFDD